MTQSPANRVDMTDLLDGDNRNARQVICGICSSKILPPAGGLISAKTFHLHVMKKKDKADAKDTEELNQFYEVDDIYTFDNIGFTNEVANVKYLICADCEVGPLGWQDLSNNKMYLALARVKHID